MFIEIGKEISHEEASNVANKELDGNEDKEQVLKKIEEARKRKIEKAKSMIQ